MQIDLINTGSELLLGRVLNTHQQWLCRKLADHGYEVSRQIAVSDSATSIRDAVAESLKNADLIVTTGGLGPTSDDLTRDLVAQLLGLSLSEDPEALANIERFFLARKRAMPISTRVQAMVPQGAVVLYNQHGTAPGLALKITPPKKGGGRTQWLVMLPGPPRELHPMFLHQALPLIQREFPLEHPFACRTLRTTGLGESAVEEKITGPLAPWTQKGLIVGYCARTGEVDVRLAAQAEAGPLWIAEAEKVCRDLLSDQIFGVEDESLESVVVRHLLEKKATFGCAESCTGGYIANRITNVPGASAVFRGGIVSYDNEVKSDLLSVPPSVIAEHGAVSEPTALAMAEGARRALRVDYALATTGIAGPSGGSDAKPVGTVFIALAGPSGIHVARHFNPFDRETFKYVTSQQALNALRRALLTVPAKT